MYYHDFLWRPRRGLPAKLLALCLSIIGLLPGGAQADTQALTLADAVRLSLKQNPMLEVFSLRLEGLEGQRLTADQAPALETAFEAENVLGSGNYGDLDGAEYTLSLSSVIELGDKRVARTQAVSGRYTLVDAERKAEALSLIGEVTRTFISTLALQEKQRLASDAVSLAKDTLEVVTRRAERGATPQAEVLRARAQMKETLLDQQRLQAALDSSLMAMSALLGMPNVDFRRLNGNLFAFTNPANFSALFKRASDSPNIQVFASEQRLRDAELALVRSQSRSDLRWQIGARYFEESGDSALVAGVSVPLFSKSRNQGQIRAAQAARNEVSLRRDSALLMLRARLYEAYQLHVQAVGAATTMQKQVIPDLERALELTRDAYEQGRYSYIEWQSAQRDLLASQRNLVDAATSALLNQALIEQLTGESLAAAAVDSSR